MKIPRKEDIVKEIARILLKRECPNWTFELANCVLRTKYLKEAEAVYELLKREKILLT